MNVIGKNIGVDSGLILVADLDFYRKHNKGALDFTPKYQKQFELPNGEYVVEWGIKGTWNGDVSGIGKLTVTSGFAIISDPCYLIQDDAWQKFLDDYEHEIYEGHHIKGCVLLDKMGGDGSYTVELKITNLQKGV